MKTLYALLILLLFQPFCALGWGKKGHRVTGHLAEQHLSRKAKRAINDLLDGHSLAFASTFADEIKADCAFIAYAPWHYVNYPEETPYETASKNTSGDIVTAIETCKKVLLNPKSSRNDRVFYLKLLVHFVGDLHQPLHAGRASDRGGNDIQLRWFDEGSNLHRVWDTDMIETYGMSYSELAEELDRSTPKKARSKLQEGSVIDWLEESHELAAAVYASAKVGEPLGYRYAYDHNALLFDCLRKGGLRLAKVLNEIFL